MSTSVHRRVIGIDFGTTYSSVALMPLGSTEPPTFIEFQDASRHVPTVLLLSPIGAVLAWGRDASDRLRTEREGKLTRNFKRDLGSGNEANDCCLKYLQQLAEHLRRTKNLSTLSDQDFITSIGAPATWSPDKDKLLKEIVENAGFPDVRVHKEPVAAMHNLRIRNKESFRFGDRSEHYMVVDFGGGTLDICIVQTDELGRNPRIRATDGNDKLGGVDFDDVIETMISKELRIDFTELTGPDRERLRSGITRVKEAASKDFCKEINSRSDTIELRDGQKTIEIDRSRFDEHCRDRGYKEALRGAVHRTLDKSKLTPIEVRRVILTGGSSAWYFVKEIVSKEMGLAGSNEIFYTDTPHTDVAAGLAILVARTDEPQGRRGVWARVKINKGDFSNYMELFSPGRTAVQRELQPQHLGQINRSRLLKANTILIEFSYGNQPGEVVDINRSTVRFFTRSNHPNLKRFRKVIDAARGVDAMADPDTYNLYLLFKEGGTDQHPVYHLEIQDIRKVSNRIRFTPGEDTYTTRFGFGKTIKVDHPDKYGAELHGIQEVSSVAAHKQKSGLWARLKRGGKG